MVNIDKLEAAKNKLDEKAAMARAIEQAKAVSEKAKEVADGRRAPRPHTTRSRHAFVDQSLDTK